MQNIKFGTGGWRAIVGEDFTYENVCRIAQGISQYMIETNQNDKPIVIGYDNRYLSPEASIWASNIFLNNGISVLQITQPVPTPLTMHMVKKRHLHFGIEITASHNPYNYNGIKVFVEEGRDAPIEVTNRLEEIIANISLTDVKQFTNNRTVGTLININNPFNDFVNDILNILNIDAIKAKGLKILIDPMYGSGYYPLNMILGTAQCVTNVIHSHRDIGFGGQLPAPTESTLSELKKLVVEGGYDLGIALDGDGDRLGIIDSNGRYVSANEILCLLYNYLVTVKGWSGPVIRNYATTHMLDKIAELKKEICYEVPIGFKHISSKIDEVDAVLGGESSGGLTVRGHIHGKDSIYAAALFVEMLSVTDSTIADLLDELYSNYGLHFMEECNLTFSRDTKDKIEDKIFVKKELPNYDFSEVVKVSYSDGCKIYFKNGFVICRFSGTEPLLRIFAESDSKETALEYINIFKNFILVDKRTQK